MSDNNAQSYRELNLVQYWMVLRKRAWAIGLFAAVLVATVIVGTLLRTPIYSATTTIEINQKAPMVLNVQEVSTDLMSVRTQEERRAFYATQYKVLRSRTVVLGVLDRLRTEHGITDFDDVEDPSDIKAVKKFREVLDIRPEGDTELVHITVESPDPAKAALYADLVAEVYMASNLERARLDSESAKERLREQREEYQDRKRKSDEEVLLFIYENGLEGAEQQQSVVQESVKNLTRDFAMVRQQRKGVETDVATLTAKLKSKDWLGLAAHLAQEDAVLQESISRLQRLREERKAAEVRYKPGMPIIAELDGKIQGQEEIVREQVAQYISGRRAELGLLREQEQSTEKQLEKAKGELNEVSKKLLELEGLRSMATKDDDYFDRLGDRVDEIDLANRIRANNVTFVDRAWENPDPIRPLLSTNVPIAVVVGLIGGVALAFALEYFDSTVKSREELELDIGVPFLGAVPQIDQAELDALPSDFARNLFAHSRPRAPVTECLRSVRTNILFRTPDKAVRRLLVTSAAPQEGKSFISSNLSAVIAMTGSKVLLIDADLRRPTQHKVFEQPNINGLSDVLADRTTLEEAVWETPVPNLHLLVAGPHPDNPAELLGSEKMKDFLDSIRGYDVIVIDSPPVSAVADPLILSGLVDGVVMTVRSNHTAKNLVLQSRQRLTEMNANILGAIVNRLDVRRQGYGYYYYYDYNSVYYADPAEERDAS